MNKFQNKYLIPSIRFNVWDYSRGGKYYVTIVTRGRECFFGDITNGKMHLNDIGTIVNDFWLQIPKHFENTWLDEYVIMPNHIHGIIVLKRNVSVRGAADRNVPDRNVPDRNVPDRNVPDRNVSDRNVPDRNVSDRNVPDRNVPDRNVPDRNVPDRNVETPNLGVSTYPNTNTDPNPKIRNPNWQHGSLGVIINQFKRICTITIRKMANRNVKTPNLGVFMYRKFGWQSRFYDEIIRNEKRLEQIRKYIQNNPANWKSDDFHI